MSKALPTLQEKYDTVIRKELSAKLKVKNILALPRLSKVNVNIGVGTYIKNGGKDLAPVTTNVTDITGQKPIITKAKKAISNFKLRAGMPVGIYVTLRKKRMNDFVDKLVNVVLPRTRDFRGISVKGFDGRGNYNLGIKDCSIFPEINPANLERPHSLQITITTTAKNNYEGYLLLKGFGFPFKDEIKEPKA